MSPESRRMLLTMLLCLAILFAWAELQHRLYPPPPRESAPAADARTDVEPRGDGLSHGSEDRISAAPDPPRPSVAQSGATEAPVADPEAGPAVDRGYRVASSGSDEPVQLGIDAPRDGPPPNPYLLALRLSPRGAAVETADLTDHRNRVARSRPAPPDTYDLLTPLVDPAELRSHLSLATRRVRLVAEKVDVDLDAALWTAETLRDEEGETAAFRTEVLHDGRPILALAKRFRVERDSRFVRMEVSIDNVSGGPLAVVLTQGGPVGTRIEEPRLDDRNVYTCVAGDHARPKPRTEVWRAEGHQIDVRSETGAIRWAGAGNKYFGCLMAPVRDDPAASAEFVRQVSARTLLNVDQSDAGDLTVDWVLAPASPLPPGGRFACAFDVYLGPRLQSVLRSDPTALRHGFDLILAADRSWCTFEWLSELMIRLFAALHRLLPGEHNYGFAIIILVLIVRTLLHPLTKKSQINMARMQKAMQSLQPKLEAIKQKHANDRQKLNEATIELYKTEGINPAGNILTCLPMFLQMPVWVALWSTLNSSVELRHEPFPPLHFWIRDLAAPDAVYPFASPWHIPLLGALTGPIASVNILPILMGVSMYLQQKYTQRLTRPDTPPPQPAAPPQPGKPTAAEQLAMQQKMMNFMTIFFSLLFYNFPSGLSVYILTSNLFGMLEQHRIRKHIRAQEKHPPPRPPAPRDGSDGGEGGPRVPRWLERLQKMAEESRQVRRKPVRR